MFRPQERNIRVAVSPFCNFECIYCDGQKGRKNNSTPGAMEDFRRNPISQGDISTHIFVEIIRALQIAGFGGITLTGGEPLLNPKWGKIVDEARELGMLRVGVTTNGMLLNKYIQKYGSLPQGLTLLTISLDTIDPERFRTVTKKGDLEEVIKGLKAAKKSNPDLTIRANKILLRSDIGNLMNYVQYCEEIDVIDEINLLNLILKDPLDKDFFEKEFVFAQEVADKLSSSNRADFFIDSRYELKTTLLSGLKVILKDTDATLRDDHCASCQSYCQEGLYTVRVATDGTITTCPDYKAELDYLDGAREVKNKTLTKKIGEMVQLISEAKQENTLKKFFRLKNVNLRYDS